MANIIAALLLLVTIYVCATYAEKEPKPEESTLQYISLDTARIKHTKHVYVPINPQIKKSDGARAAKTVLKIRNTSFSDSLYVSAVDYYGVTGKLLKNLIDSALLVRPMATTEITVRNNGLKTGGDNFIVRLHTCDSTHKPIVQAISMNTGNKVVTTDQGIILLNGVSENVSP